MNGGPSEVNKNWKADTGFSDADTSAMTAAFRWVADKTYATVLGRGKYVWVSEQCTNEAAEHKFEPACYGLHTHVVRPPSRQLAHAQEYIYIYIYIYTAHVFDCVA